MSVLAVSQRSTTMSGKWCKQTLSQFDIHAMSHTHTYKHKKNNGYPLPQSYYSVFPPAFPPISHAFFVLHYSFQFYGDGSRMENYFTSYC